MIRRLLFAAGVLAGLSGLALVIVPGIATGVGISDVLVYLLGTLALLLAVAGIQRRRHAQRREIQTPEPETPVGLPAPGDDVDERLRNLRRFSRRGRIKSERRDLDERLEELAIRIIARRDDISRGAAERRLRDGSWTDDRLAAAFFSDDVELPVGKRLRLSLRTGSPASVYATHAIEVLADSRLRGPADE